MRPNPAPLPDAHRLFVSHLVPRSSDPDHEHWLANNSSVPVAASQPPAACGDVEATHYAKHRKHGMRKNQGRRRLSSERLPNPFVGPLQPAVSSSTSREYRDRPGLLNTAVQTSGTADRTFSAADTADNSCTAEGAHAHAPSHSRAGTGGGGVAFNESLASHGSYGSDGSSDSSTTGGLATIYSPEQV